VDCFRFSARAGQTLVFDLLAARMELPLDAMLTLLDASGREIALDEDANDLDPLLVTTFSQDGDYTLVVRDLLYRGGERYAYRLLMGQIPFVTAVFPLGGRPGAEIDLQLLGVNLGSPTCRVAVPAATASSLVRKALLLPTGASNSVALATDEAPEVMEEEGGEARPPTGGQHPGTNDDPATAQTVQVPGVVDGRLFVPAPQAPGPQAAPDGGSSRSDSDCYRFHAEKGQPLVLEVIARRLGSELDSVLAVLDATGKELATNDDAEGHDSRLEFTAPETGEYVARVRDLYDRQGPGYTYRLRLSATPDFRLSFSPDRLSVGRGGRVPLTVRSARINGFDGEIPLELTGLPPGVSVLGPSRIRTGRQEALLVLSAAPDAPLQAGPFAISGRSTGEGGVRRAAQSLEEIRGGDEQQRRPRPLPVAAVTEAPDVVVTAEPATVRLAPGGSVEITVKVTRREGFTGALELVVLGLPEGVSAETPEIPKEKSESKVTLKARGEPVIGETEIVVAARFGIEGGPVYHTSAPITLTIAR
jgi:hypothetical protein